MKHVVNVAAVAADTDADGAAVPSMYSKLAKGMNGQKDRIYLN